MQTIQYTNEEINQLVWIGFCQPKFYKQSVWKKAKEIMLRACEMGIGVEYRPHRGAGHFWTTSGLKVESVIWAIVQRYGNPTEPFIVNQYGKTYEVYDLEDGVVAQRNLLSKYEADTVAKNLNLLKQVLGVAV